MPRQATIRHATFEALLPFADGRRRWLYMSEQGNNLYRRGLVRLTADGMSELTSRGREALDEYAARHNVTIPKEV